jgi:signal transduction histidine kinase
MKLFAKYNRINIAASIFSFLLGSLAFYFILQYVLIRQLDESLRAEQQEINEFIHAHGQLPEIENTKHQWVQIEKTSQRLDGRMIGSYRALNHSGKEYETIRQLTYTVSVGPDLYRVTVNKSEVETEDLLQLIIAVTVGMIGLILLINYLVNRTIVNRIWQPFNDTIREVEQYDLRQRKALSLKKEPIEEFNLLNESLVSMTERISGDYQNLKAFTENASHEIQTPLAIIRSKAELLLQDSGLNRETMIRLVEIEDGIRRLSRIQQSLLLLTKIENSQFNLTEPVNLKEILEKRLEEKRELMEARNIRLSLNLEALTLPFHPHLADILVSNLLNNAIRYTPDGGEIKITLDENMLQCSNSASGPALDPEKIFQRFYKSEQNNDGTGIGLAIAREICKAAGYRIEYGFNLGYHQFKVHFK